MPTEIGHRAAGRFYYHRGTAPEYPLIGNPAPDVLWRLDMSELAIEERSGVMTLSTTEIKRLSRRLPIRLRDSPETRGYRRETGRRCDCSYCLS